MELKIQRLTLQGIINSAREPIFSVDRQYRYTGFNSAHASVIKAIYGKDIEIGSNLLDYMTVKEDREKAKRNLDRALTGESFVQEAYSGEEARSRLYFTVSHSPITATGGAIVGVAVVAKDITERKRVEEALRESEAKYRMVVDQSLEGIVIAHASPTRLVFANPMIAKILGYAPDDLTALSQKKIEGLVHPEDRAAFFGRFSDRLQGKPVPLRYEVRGIRKDGEERWLEISSNRIEYNRQPAVQATFVDITERKRVEEERDRLFNLSIDMLCIAGFDGYFKRLNPAWERTLGWTSRQLMSKPYLDFVHPEDREGTINAAQNLSEGMKVNTFDNRYLCKDGTYKWISWNSFPFMEERLIIAVARDITDRRRMEAELEKQTKHLEELVEAKTADLAASARTYQLLVDNLADAVFTIDLEGNLTFPTPQTEKMTGYTTQQLRSMNIKELIAPEDLPAVLRRLEARSRGVSELSPIQFDLVRADGARLPIEIHTKLLCEGNKPVGVQGVARDVTERKRMEDALRESERRFREMTDMLPEIVFELDANGELTFLNQAELKMLGYDEKDLRRGLSAFQVIAPEDHKALRENIRRVLNGGASPGYEYVMLRKDGSRFPGIAYATPIIKGGKAFGLRGVVVDITERKRMEEELQDSKRRLEYIVKTNPAAIFSGKPLPDYSDWYATYVSDRVIGISGFEPQELVGNFGLWNSRIHPDDFPFYLARIPCFFRDGHASFDYRFLHKNGVYRWIREEVASTRDADGKLVEVNGCWTDITELKEMEQRLKQAERLAGIGEAAAMVGHDLRNPLQGITGAAYVLRTHEGSLSEEGREMLHVIEDGIERSDKIINDLLTYSGELHLELSTINAKMLIDQTLAGMKIPENINVVNNAENHPAVQVDVEKMQRVCVNLIKNAVDAMPNGGALTITSTDSDGNLLVSFKDTGEGISEEILGKIWSPLFTTKAKGMGYGLAIVKRFIEAHGGAVSLETNLGKGSTFTISIPLHRKAEAPMKTRSEDERQPDLN
jgi:PAS domain S-box-containing protein